MSRFTGRLAQPSLLSTSASPQTFVLHLSLSRSVALPCSACLPSCSSVVDALAIVQHVSSHRSLERRRCFLLPARSPPSSCLPVCNPPPPTFSLLLPLPPVRAASRTQHVRTNDRAAKSDDSSHERRQVSSSVLRPAFGYRQQVHCSPSLALCSLYRSVRNSLFGSSRGGGSAAGGGRNGVQMAPYGRSSSGLQDRIYAEQSERVMESQNDELTSRLSEKVTLLKQLSIDIGVEVKEQNRMLNAMVTISRDKSPLAPVCPTLPHVDSPARMLDRCGSFRTRTSSRLKDSCRKR